MKQASDIKRDDVVLYRGRLMRVVVPLAEFLMIEPLYGDYRVVGVHPDVVDPDVTPEKRAVAIAKEAMRL